VRNQISHQHKRKSKIIVPFVSIFMSFDRIRKDKHSELNGIPYIQSALHFTNYFPVPAAWNSNHCQSIIISVCILVMQNKHAISFTSIYFQTSFLFDSDGFPLFYMVLMLAPSNWKNWGHRKKANGLTPFTPPSRILCLPFNHISLHFPSVGQTYFWHKCWYW
jgi:hypothetical protein